MPLSYRAIMLAKIREQAMSVASVFKAPSDLIKNVRHKNEKPRRALALLGITPIIIALISLIAATNGAAIIYICEYMLFIWFLLWFFGKTVKAALLMNLVEVNEKNFEKLHGIIVNAKEILKYNKPIDAFVWSGSQVGLTVLHHLDREIFLIESSFLKGSPPDEVLIFTVMFHVARLKTKSEYFALLTEIISGIEKLWVLNIFLYPFERATVYTADRVAMIYSGTSDYAQQAFSREMVGPELGASIDANRVAEQGVRCRGFFAWIARAYSPFPGYSHRFVELNKFANSAVNLMMERHRP